MATTKKTKQPRKISSKKAKRFVETSFLPIYNGKPMIDVIKGDIDTHVKNLVDLKVPFVYQNEFDGKKHYILGNGKDGYVVYTEL